VHIRVHAGYTVVSSDDADFELIKAKVRRLPLSTLPDHHMSSLPHHPALRLER